MKRILKLLALSFAAFVLVACGKSPEDSTESSSSVESAVESSQASQSTSTEESDASESESTQEESHDESTRHAEVDETKVAVEVFIAGESQPIASFNVEPTEDMSVLDLMSNHEGLDVHFNEELGTVDEINGTANDYDAGNTWVYLLNGQLADYGVVSQKVKAGDRITWYYGTLDELPIEVQHPDAPRDEVEKTDETEGEAEGETHSEEATPDTPAVEPQEHEE